MMRWVDMGGWRPSMCKQDNCDTERSTCGDNECAK